MKGKGEKASNSRKMYKINKDKNMKQKKSLKLQELENWIASRYHLINRWEGYIVGTINDIEELKKQIKEEEKELIKKNWIASRYHLINRWEGYIVNAKNDIEELKKQIKEEEEKQLCKKN
jgi:thermostable 8-oxoguanine DNA glycosylase